MDNQKNKVCLMFDHRIEEAINFYVKTFPNSSIKAVHRAPTDFPSGKAGDVLTMEFDICGIPCLAVNGGDHFKHSEAFSLQISTDNQEETDALWNAIVNNDGEESVCGWCKDKWGLSWQITPKALTKAMAQGGEVSKKAFTVMMTMKKIDIKKLEEAIANVK